MLALLVLSGGLAAGRPPASTAQERELQSPRELLAWPRAADPRHARQLPLTAFDGRIAASVYFVRETTSVAVYDPRSNRVYSGGESGPIAGASLSKVLLAIIALQQLERREPSDEEIASTRALIYPTIAYSDNDYANDIWELIGRQEAVNAFAVEQGLPGFRAPHPWDWGQISATGRDWAILFAMLGSGQILNPDNTATLLAMMGDVIEEHRWGVLTRRDDSVSYGKNGWYMDEDESFAWRVNSAGFVSVAEPDAGMTPRVVVILTRYPGRDGMSYGVEFATRFTDSVIACTHAQQARSTFSQRTASCTSHRETALLMQRARAIW
jgi:hypothetical protein